MNCAGQEMILNWEKAFRAGADIVGGKGWNLARLARYGFTIPAGGVLTTTVYGDFIKHNRLQEAVKTVSAAVSIDNLDDMGVQAQVDALRKRFLLGFFPPAISEKIHNFLKELGIEEKPLAVRSSASWEDSSAASFAGIHDSFLNVQGTDNILAAIKNCYASIWSPRAVAYRRKMGINDFDIAPAVVIMEMVPAESAGVAFSCDPRTGREDRLLINANFGLGESVVAGAVEPDEYTLEIDLKGSLPRIINRKIGKKEGITVAGKKGGTEFIKSPKHQPNQVLSDTKISELGLLLLRIFAALGDGEHHQDVEWVFSDGKFILVQSRPVTTLPKYISPKLRKVPQYWSNGNFRDAAPMVLSTVNWSSLKHALKAILDAPFNAGGYPIQDGMQHARLFHGRVYYNLSMTQWNSYDGFGILPKETNNNLGGHQPEIPVDDEKPFRGIEGLKRICRIAKLVLKLEGTKRKAPKSFIHVRNLTEALMKEDYKSLNDRELLLKFSAVIKILLDFSPIFGLLAATSANIMYLIKELEKDFPGKGNALATALMAGCAEITSAAQGYRLMEMAEMVRRDIAAEKFFAAEPFTPLSWEKDLPDDSSFKQSFKGFLSEFGHRGVYEVEIMNPRWREDPSYLLHAVRSTIRTSDLSAIRDRQKVLSDGAWQEVSHKVPWHRLLLLRFLAKQSRAGAEMREMAKSVYCMPFEPLRKMLMETGSRLEKRRIIREQADVFHCDWHELISILRGDWSGKGLATLVDERKARSAEMEKLSPPDLFIEDIPQHSEQAPDCSGKALVGLGVAAGVGNGPACVVLHPDEGKKLAQGNVLVAPSTDPAWTPLFLRASAIVMETGGHLSHGAIVAREYGIPAVVNISGVLRVLDDGQQIVVDGNAGKVFL